MYYELIVDLRNVPSGESVRKISGEKQYTVSRNLKIYAEHLSEKREIKCDDRCVFLISSDGNISMHSEANKVVWMVHKSKLIEYLHSDDYD